MAEKPLPESEALVTEVEVPPTTLKEELRDTFKPVRKLLFVNDDPFHRYRGKTVPQKLLAFVYWAFPIVEWLSTYKSSYVLGDLIGGLTIASLAVPQVGPTPSPSCDWPAGCTLLTSSLFYLWFAAFGVGLPRT